MQYNNNVQTCFIMTLVHLILKSANTPVVCTSHWLMPSVKCNVFCDHRDPREGNFALLWKYSPPIASVFTSASSNAIRSFCTGILCDSFVTCWENLLYVAHAHAYTHKYTRILIDVTFFPSAFTLVPIARVRWVSIPKGPSAWDFCSSASMVGVRYTSKWVKSCRYPFISRSPHLLPVWILWDKSKINKKCSSVVSTTN